MFNYDHNLQSVTGEYGVQVYEIINKLAYWKKYPKVFMYNIIKIAYFLCSFKKFRILFYDRVHTRFLLFFSYFLQQYDPVHI